MSLLLMARRSASIVSIHSGSTDQRNERDASPNEPEIVSFKPRQFVSNLSSFTHEAKLFANWKTRDASANELKTAANPPTILKLSSFAHESRTIEIYTKTTPKANQHHKAGAGSYQNKCRMSCQKGFAVLSRFRIARGSETNRFPPCSNRTESFLHS